MPDGHKIGCQKMDEIHHHFLSEEIVHDLAQVRRENLLEHLSTSDAVAWRHPRVAVTSKVGRRNGLPTIGFGSENFSSIFSSFFFLWPLRSSPQPRPLITITTSTIITCVTAVTVVTCITTQCVKDDFRCRMSPRIRHSGR